ncbi:MAG: DUF2851 family protein [Bacteroidales bacterium]|nr:DUF2851 family protein [Bacteroidales bacterium]
MTEAFLQYVWQHKLLRGDLQTSEGLPVIIERPGDPNTDAGPDFFNARLQMGAVRWAGNVEIHVKASDWNQHRHSFDKKYNSVVLHVVFEHDCNITLENGKRVATLEIKDHVPMDIWDSYQQMVNPSHPLDVACLPRLQKVPRFLFDGFLDRQVIERMERKTYDVKSLLEDSRDSWETTCYWLIARYFGGKANGFAFEMMAKLTPMKVLAKIKDNPFRVEALLMGQAGLLEESFVDEYPLRLQREYTYMRKAYSLSPMAGHLWKFFRLRPASFPTLRISQFADLVCKSNALFSHLMETTNIEELRCFFDVSASDYWTNHYYFDRPSAPLNKAAGQAFADIVLINALAPLLFEYGVLHGNQDAKDRAIDILRHLPPENNRITRQWGNDHRPQNAAQSQALIQLYNEHCTQKNCLRCAIGYHALKPET